MSRPVIHILGAGLAGLAAAAKLAEGPAEVVLHEATDHAGGRCRSYFEPALDQLIDNGNHLLLSGNRAALAFVARMGGAGALAGPGRAAFDFADLRNGQRWQVRISEGRLPRWIFSPAARVPGTRARDYLGARRLLTAGPGDSIGQVMACRGPLYERLLGPVLLAALNTEPEAASARLAAAVLRESLLRGGAACRPLIADPGLSAAFIDPALAWLAARGILPRFGHRLRRIELDRGRVAGLDFGEDRIALGPGDAAILAVPATVAGALLPDLGVPESFRAILNAHFRISPPAGWPRILGVIGGTVEWLFAFGNRLSITVSAADRLMERDREDLARALWAEVARLTGLGPGLPPWQIVKEKRATFAALPAEEARRPGPETRWANLVLAGDWTATGLPATIEGAIRSGERAAAALLSKGLVHPGTGG
jgi:hydroxysqualene dehydroxylase